MGAVAAINFYAYKEKKKIDKKYHGYFTSNLNNMPGSR